MLLQCTAWRGLQPEEGKRGLHFLGLVGSLCFFSSVFDKLNADRISIFTLLGGLLEVAGLVAYKKENAPNPVHEKTTPGGRQPLDAPADTQTPAGTV